MGGNDDISIYNTELWEFLNQNIMENKKQLKEERAKIVKGLEEAYRKRVEFKKSKNTPLVLIRNGKIMEIDTNDEKPTVFCI